MDMIGNSFRKGVIALSMLGLLGLGACASSFSNALGNVQGAYSEVEAEREAWGQLTREDLEEALRSANAHDDVIAAACWTGLLTKLDELGAEGFFTEPKGVFSSFQKARNARRLITGGFSDEIKLACAALKDDSFNGIRSIVGIVSPL
jgi:hypothetical protein